jgi:hypothetical protein
VNVFCVVTFSLALRFATTARNTHEPDEECGAALLEPLSRDLLVLASCPFRLWWNDGKGIFISGLCLCELRHFLPLMSLTANLVGFMMLCSAVQSDEILRDLCLRVCMWVCVWGYV